jgi:hypothetical protein
VKGDSPVSEVRIRQPGRAVQYMTSEVRIRLRNSPVNKADTADRDNTATERITEKNPGAGLQDEK